MITVYIENKDWYVIGIDYETLEDIVLYTNTFGEGCKITIEETHNN